jgi:hypothetical protein
MSDFIELVLRQRTYNIPKKVIHKLLADQADGDNLTKYVVQASVPLRVFEEFVRCLEIETIPEVTRENAKPLGLLASEFRLPDLAAKCDTAVPLPIGIGECLWDPEVALRALLSERERMRAGATMRLWREQLDKAGGLPSASAPRSDYAAVKIECRERDSGWANGIIARLARLNGLALHKMAIVTVISNSVCDRNPKWAPENILNFDDTESFRSKDAPCEWVCWTFHFRQVIVTEYTIVSCGLQSWSLEGSTNGWWWTVIDQRKNTEEFKGDHLATATFRAVANVPSRYIRLIQAGPNHWRHDRYCLHLNAVEFYGTLLEQHYV